MSKNKTTSTLFESSISDEQIVDFMDSRNVKPTCPCCGHTQWHRLEEPLWGTNYKVQPYLDSPSGFEVVVLYCMQCGFVRQHAAHLIRRARENEDG